MSPGLVTDIGRANKMFRTERPGVSGASPRELWRELQHLSDYIRYALCEKRQSVWIAQRGGRTKDGLDVTDPAVLKMFLMSSPADPVDALCELHLAPIAISYEWEPCDTLKVLELYASSRAAYEKQPGEDLNSILTGITQPKGRIHMAFCKPLDAAELEAFRGLPSSVFCRDVAALIDRRIRSAYRLFPNNYIAADLLRGGDRYASYYDAAQKAAFEAHLKALDRYDTYDVAELRSRMLALYANPVGDSIV